MTIKQRVAAMPHRGKEMTIDKFGFVIEDGDDATTASDRNNDETILKMEKMLSTAVGEAKGPTASMMKNFARKGFPDSLRQRAWIQITGVDKIMKERSGSYESLVNSVERLAAADAVNGSSGGGGGGSSLARADSLVGATTTKNRKTWAAIEKDIPRTFPKHQMFCSQEESTNPNDATSSSSGGRASLRRVLRAYSQYDSDVGYCQGMNFIAAMFLIFTSSEEEAFWLLVVVMNEEPYKLRELYGEDMSGTKEVLFIADKLMKQFVPKLTKHFDNEGIHNSMFVTQWFMTIFTSTFPFHLVSRVWDAFLVEGWKVIYRVMLVLLKNNEQDLLQMEFEKILNYLREFPTKVDGQVIMSSSYQMGLKEKHVMKLATEYKQSLKDEDSAKGDSASVSVGSVTLESSKKSSKLNRIKLTFRKSVKKELGMDDDNVSVTLSTIDHQTSESLSSEDRINIIMKKMAEVKQHIKEVEGDADFDDETRAKMLAKFVERKNELAKELIGGGSSEA